MQGVLNYTVLEDWMYDMSRGIAINIIAPPAEPVELSGVQFYLMFPINSLRKNYASSS